MTIEEFRKLYPREARMLELFTGAPTYAVIDGVYRREDERWEAHIVSFGAGETEIVVEARCKPWCLRGIGVPYVWHYEDHVCCAECENNPRHRYEVCHE